MKLEKAPVLLAIAAAVCYGISVPVSKLLLEELSPVFMAALLYLGAGIGMFLVKIARGRHAREAKITKKELPCIAAVVVLDIAAAIFLMIGVSMTTSANASLMSNFEIVATSVIAFLFFKEAVGKSVWIAILLITVSSMLLSVEDFSSFSFSAGSVFVLLGCVCWGLENNCTRMLSLKDPLQITMVKGFGSGLGSLVIAAVLSDLSGNFVYILLSLLLGFAAYGLSIFFYIHAQRQLGAARTSSYYAFAPFIGVGLSFLVFGQTITLSFTLGFLMMAAGAYFAAHENHVHRHIHEELSHDHRHSHNDGHHEHLHNPPVEGEHSHVHVHPKIVHTHAHTPDLHHQHLHKISN